MDNGRHVAARARRLTTWQLLLGMIGLVMALASCAQTSGGQVTSTSTQTVTAHTTATTSAGTPTDNAGASYHVAGNQILDSNGQPFIPDGVQLTGPSMAERNWQTNDSSEITLQMVQAARTFWHSNTTRLQISSANLFAQSPYSTAYLNRIDQIVGWANGQGMNIILSLQYEVTTKQYMPTQDSLNFWQVIAAHYATNPHVFFDAFNEPSPNRLIGQTTDSSQTWTFWQNGGMGNDGAHYDGMQQVVDTIRGTGAQNLVLVEGPAFGKDLRQMPNYLIHGSNLVYAIHPYLNLAFLVTTAQWDAWFGNFATSGVAPVVADEWGAFEGQSNNACFPSIPQVVPQLLNYLASHHIGLVAFALNPGTLIRGWNVTTPTRYDPGVATCNPATGSPNMDPNAQGAGQDVLQFLQANSRG